jgi:sugar/nucleoside kinase (ribokinase family)
MTTESADIVIIGHLAKDIIEVDGISNPSLGGAVYYGGIAGSHMGLKITIVTLLNKEDFPFLDVFKRSGIKYYAYPSPETSGLKNIYSSKNMEFRDYKPLGFAGLFKKEQIPDINTRYFVVGPILAGEIDLNILRYIKKMYPDNLGIDMQGFIRFRSEGDVYYSSIPSDLKKEILSKATILKVDQKEAEILTEQSTIEKAAKELLLFGPEEILVTHAKGISLFTNNKAFNYPWKNKESLGRTGRGDTAFISYIGSRISQSPQKALRFAAALTSLKMEAPGPFALPLYQVTKLMKNEY